MKLVPQPVNQETWLSVQNANLARIWERKVNVRRVRSARLKNVQIYISFRAAKQIAPITATTALLNSKRIFNYYRGERK